MPLITFLPSGKRVEVEKGRTILSAAQDVGEGIRSLCGGKGSCGKCRVAVRKGEVQVISEEAHEKFIKDEGYYLACQTAVVGDVEVFIPPESRLEKQQILKEFFVEERDFNPAVRVEHYTDAFLPEILSEKGYRLSITPEVEEGELTLVIRNGNVIDVLPGKAEVYGLAIDVGTTTIVAALVDLTDGRILNIASDYNGQIIYGEEVLSRVEFARSRRDGIMILQKAVVDSINRLVENLLEGYASPDRIYDVVAAGNTLMTHFLIGKDVEYLFSSSDVKLNRKGYEYRGIELGLRVNDKAGFYALPSVGRFIGGDIVGDIIASKIVDSATISLMVDLGTNGEIVIGSEGWAMATSVASGPAFEGYEIKHGSRAVEGAIDHVKIEGDEVVYSVVGNTKPRSICGSGLIDLLAELFKNGIVDVQGTLKRDHPRVILTEDGAEFVVAEADESATGKPITFTEKDIETLIKSKAAVCAGIAVLVKKAGLSMKDIDDFYIAGAFGYYIDFDNAVTIGLFPEMRARVHQIGNGSLAGAYMVLTSRRKRELADTIAAMFAYFDLATDADFVDEYRAAISLPGKAELFPEIYAKYV
ncbi:ASKHA domain-containing protein [Archaeoglobus neptunius]|uniref:ASKHA domain-containing protein n=1 Tax=Archaeoglobus neptunius TaxID=2798580 RepID=UPI0019267EC8|nr:ASKHA domain-containing protein [Archaeoglobus neptunius]